MSRCGDFFVRVPGWISVLCTLIAIPWLSTTMAVPVYAQAPAAVTIETVHDFPLGEQLELSVDLAGRDLCTEIGGFELTVAFDPTLLSIIDVEPGELIDQCGWEIFRFQIDSLTEHVGQPLGPVVRILAVAGTSQFPDSATGSSTELARLIFNTSSQPDAACGVAPVNFVWLGCNDNNFADLTGDSVFTSSRVFGFGEVDITDDQPFPTYSGLPGTCWDTLSFPMVDPLRSIDFHSGGVRFMCDSSTVPDTSGAIIAVERLQSAVLGEEAIISVDLVAQSQTFEVAGFDLLLSYPADRIIFTGAQQGSMLADCSWDYFSYRIDTLGGRHVIRLVAIESTHNTTFNPPFDSISSGELAQLSFFVPIDTALLGETVPIEWIWFDCGDNTLSTRSGDTLLVSRLVYDMHGFEITAADDFPTLFGTQEQCLSSAMPIRQTIDFFSGGIEQLEMSPTDFRGDVNLNWIAYEIADWVLFGNYFYLGPEVFITDSGLQTAATDVDWDGVSLTLADFMHLLCVITGISDPLTEGPVSYPVDTITFVQDTEVGSVNLVCNNPLGAILLDFEGEMVPTIMIDTTRLIGWYKADSGHTRVMVYPALQTLDNWSSVDSGLLLTYTGAGRLIRAEAADYDNTHYVSHIERSGDPGAETVVRISSVEAPLGSMAEVEVLLEKAGNEPGGFDFLITYDQSALDFVSAEPGSVFYDDCEWEYFSYRSGPFGGCDTACPEGMIRVVGIADDNDGDYHPTCYLPDELPVSILSLRFNVTEDRTRESDYLPVGFVWTDCGDNAFSSTDGLTLWVSSNVYTPQGGLIPIDYVFPSFGGVVPECLSSSSKNPLVSSIDYYNGGIQVRVADSAYATGDLNGNGVAFEVADAILFVLYFIEGTSVFPEPIDLAIASSDIDGDGIPLTLADFVRMIRIILNDLIEIPSSEPSPNVAVFQIDEALNTVSVQTLDSLGAVYLGFDGMVQPVLKQQVMSLKHSFDGQRTHVMVSSLSSGHYVESGELISFSGDGTLDKIETATFDGRTVTTKLDSPTDISSDEGLPTVFGLNQNYPNPFNPSTEISFSLPVATHARLNVYNALGQVVTTVVDRNLSAGEHTFQWDGTGRASGVYFYRLVTDTDVDTRKMVLMK